MTIDQLIALGATSCGGAIDLKGVCLGYVTNGEFNPTEAGLRKLQDLEDAPKPVVKPAAAKPAKPAKPAKLAKVVEAPAHADDDTQFSLSGLDD